jgi:hypothetical protein
MTHITTSRFHRPLLIGGLAAVLLGGSAGGALAATSGGHHDHGERVKPHCVTVYLSGATVFNEKNGHRDYGAPQGKGNDAATSYGNRKGEETYSITATGQVCESKDGKLTTTIDPKTIAGAETEAQGHGGK